MTFPHSAWWFIIDALAVARLSRLVTTDTITSRSRLWLAKRTDRLALWLACPWCISVWVAAAVVTATVLIPAVWVYIAAVLAFSYVAGFLSEWDA